MGNVQKQVMYTLSKGREHYPDLFDKVKQYFLNVTQVICTEYTAESVKYLMKLMIW